MAAELQINDHHMNGLSGMQSHHQTFHRPQEPARPPPGSRQVTEGGTMATITGNIGDGDEEEERGRPREQTEDAGEEGGQPGDGQAPATRRRRRSRKDQERKFECPHPGCGKFYSRAEHLYRHQLNRKFIS